MKSGVFSKGMGAAAAVCLLAIATAPGAWAHHAGVNFDMNKVYIYQGTVRRWLWANPHAWLYVEVRKADGSAELWGFESAGTNALSRVGVHADTVKPGDRISVYAAPDKTGIHNAMLRKIVLADGRELSVFGPPPAGVGQGGGRGAPNGTAAPQTGDSPSLFGNAAPAVEYK